jgi:F420-dependent oxidoreductase-like protein
MSRVRFGIYFDYYLDFAKLKLRVLEAEALGYHSVWIMDHLIWKGNQLPFNEKGSVLESWTILSALASLTRKIRLGTLVLCNSYRNPTLLAKMASTLDNISNGRLELGMGAGWHKEEYVAYGFPFPEVKHRIMQLREALIIIKKMWAEKKPSFQGRYYNIKGAICEPKPLQKPHPPLWIGGAGEKLMLKVVAELADGYNVGVSPQDFGRKMRILKKYCKRVNRDFNAIQKSWVGEVIVDEDEDTLARKIEALKPKQTSLEEYLKSTIVGSPEKCVEKVSQYVREGATLFILLFRKYKEDTRLFMKKVAPKVGRVS